MPCVKSGARAGSLYRNLVAHALTLGASGDRAPVRQQPCLDVGYNHLHVTQDVPESLFLLLARAPSFTKGS